MEGILSRFVTNFHTLLLYSAECELSKQTIRTLFIRRYLKLIRFFTVKMLFLLLYNLPAEVRSEYRHHGQQAGRGIEEDRKNGQFPLQRRDNDCQAGT